jgi:uncharacterized protein (TIRG00374 family)
VKKRLNLIIGILISALFIYLAFRRVQLSDIISSLRSANYFFILPNMAVVILGMMIRAERWRYLLGSIGRFKAKELFPSVMIGFMANNLLPARLGEVVRAYSLGAKTGHSRSSIFATIVLERLFDSLSLLAMFWLVILFIPFPAPVKKFGIVTLIVNLLIIIFLIILKRHTTSLVRLALKICFFLPEKITGRLEHIMYKFAQGLSIFQNRRALFVIVIWSVILWLITALSNYFVFMAFGLYPSIAASFILLIFVAAGVMLPSAPGFVGVFQAATIGAFVLLNNLSLLGQQSIGPFGVTKGEALSFSIILWLCSFLPVTLLGLYYLRREHLSLKSLEIVSN